MNKKINLFNSVVLILLIAGSPLLAKTSSYKKKRTRRPNPIQTQITHLKRSSLAIESVSKRAKPAVVNISLDYEQDESTPEGNIFDIFGEDPDQNENQPDKRANNLGSGVLISKDGKILTNFNNIRSAAEITVTLSDSRVFKAKLIGGDPLTDLALIKIKGKNFPVIKLGNSDKLKVGDWVMALGSPFENFQTVSVGIISAKERSDGGVGDYEDFLHTDANINPGNSGGALINLDGELIGINTSLASIRGGYLGTGLSVPISTAKEIIIDLEKFGRVIRGWMGVQVQPISRNLQRQYRLRNRKGALIKKVIDDSPSYKAGLRVGDVIVKYRDNYIIKSYDLHPKILAEKLGAKVPIEIIRHRKVIRKIILIETSPQDKQALLDKIGLFVVNLSNPSKNKKGISIGDIDYKSPAYDVGLRTGDLILDINQQKIQTVQDYHSVLNLLSKGEKLVVYVQSAGTPKYVTFGIE